jgi:NADH:ubiquinone oxidoreductase subunit 2 (subunit N)
VALAAVALLLVLVLAPAPPSRPRLIATGGTGLAGTILVAAAPTFDLALLALLATGIAQAAIDGRRPFATRLRAPAVAVALLALAAVFARVEGPEIVHRFAAVGLATGLAVALGVLPFLHPFDPEELVTASPVAWLAYVGPVVAAVIVADAHGILTVDAGEGFGAMLIALGLLNMAGGSIAAWRAENGASAWRYSFVADWGLALCGFGLGLPDGRRAALLVMFTLLWCRLPLYVASRQSLREHVVADRPVNLLVAGALAGSAPFAGFAARVLLLRAATQLNWPLALVLVLGMLLWLPASLRLGRSLGVPSGRQAVGVAIVLAVNVAGGLYPLPLLAAARV